MPGTLTRITYVCELKELLAALAPPAALKAIFLCRGLAESADGMWHQGWSFSVCSTARHQKTIAVHQLATMDDAVPQVLGCVFIFEQTAQCARPLAVAAVRRADALQRARSAVRGC